MRLLTAFRKPKLNVTAQVGPANEVCGRVGTENARSMALSVPTDLIRSAYLGTPAGTWAVTVSAEYSGGETATRPIRTKIQRRILLFRDLGTGLSRRHKMKWRKSWKQSGVRLQHGI